MSGHIAKVSHQVFFWLKNPDSAEDLEQLLPGIRSLSTIETVRGLHVGVPVATQQPSAIDSDCSASVLLFFDSIEEQNTYQTHPLHEQFIADHAHLWSRVAMFDAVSCAPENEFGM